LGLLLTVFSLLMLRLDPWRSLACTSPLLGSSIVLSGSVWLTTDNAAWMFVALALGSAALTAVTPGRIARAGIWSALAVFIRQIHIWVIGPIALAGLWEWRARCDGR